MFELLEFLLSPFLDVFAVVFRADSRPEARRLTIGCAVVVVAVIALFILWVGWQRGFQ